MRSYFELVSLNLKYLFQQAQLDRDVVCMHSFFHFPSMYNAINRSVLRTQSNMMELFCENS